MWYALVDLNSDYHTETRIFFGEEQKHVAAQLIKVCDEAMQFDLAEMSMEEIDDYYTEGYDNYEALQERPSGDVISSFYFQCNDVKIKVFRFVQGYGNLMDAFEAYTKEKRKLSTWKMVPVGEEDKASLRKLDVELQSLSGTVSDPSKLVFFALKDK